MSCKRAGIVIIGDEILKGHTNDSNAVFVCQRLHSVGVRVCRIAIVADDLHDIAEEVSRMSQRFDFVIACGGIGPTHDDITYEGIAKAFDEPLEINNEMATFLQSFFAKLSEEPNSEVLKMAKVPRSSKLIYVTDSPASATSTFPIIQVRNVYVLPGIPKWCQAAYCHLEPTLASHGVRFYTKEIWINGTELQIIHILNNVVAQVRNKVSIGCYPIVKNNSIEVLLKLESLSLDDACYAYDLLLSGLPKEIVDLTLTLPKALQVYDLAKGCSNFSVLVADSIKIIEEGLKKYDSEDIYLSFNGGKDCTALLHLLWAVLSVNSANSTAPKPIISTLYVKGSNPFLEAEHFIQDCTVRYGLHMATVNMSIKEALEWLLVRKPNVKAIWMGTRSTDPYSDKLNTFQMCDAGWPQVERISPLLNWSYDDIWGFIRVLSIPYCPLYDVGYTSLGDVPNTLPNPALLKTGSQSEYLPAYRLDDATKERQGRIRNNTL